MSKNHLPGLLACSILVLAGHHALAGPARSFKRIPFIQTDVCPVTVEVGEDFGQAYVNLQKTLEFYLKPNQPKMSVIFQGDDSVYKASVEGTMIKLFGCDALGDDCTLVNQGGTKGRDLLVVDNWNLVKVNYIDGEISVDVNMKTNVMGKNAMPMAKGTSKGRGSVGNSGYLSFVVPPNSPTYDATLNVSCNANGRPPYIQAELPGFPTIQTELPDSPTPLFTTPAYTNTSRMDSRPYPGCPVYRIEADHPSPSSGGYQKSFTFGVNPSHPALHMDITSNNFYFKVRVDGATGEMNHCNMAGRQCSTVASSQRVDTILDPNKWNDVTVYLDGDEINMKVNNTVVLSYTLETVVHRGLKVVVLAPLDTTTEGSGYFTALVNVLCVGPDQQITQPSTAPTTTRDDLPTKDSIIASTEPTPKSGSSGLSRDVSIVVGVLVCALIIVTIAIVISTYKKRRAATINEHSPLKNQQEQEQHK